MRRRILTACIGLAAATILLSEAAGAAAQALDLKKLPPGQTRQVKIGVGGVASPTQLGIWITQYAGLLDPLKQEGIQVELVPFGGGSDAMLALVGGQTQFTYQFAENAIRARAQGRDVTIVYNALPVAALSVTVRTALADKVKTVKDLAGMRWGFTSFGSGSHVVSLRVAKRYGLEQNQVQWTPVGGTRGYLPSMREARVDALTSGIEAGNQLVQEGTAFMLVDLADPKVVQEVYGYPYISIALMTTKAYSQREPYVTFKIVEALEQAMEHIKKTPAAEIARLLPSEFQSASLELSIKTLVAAHSVEGVTDPEVIEKMMDDIEELKVARTSRFKAADMVDNRFVEALPRTRR